MASEGFQLQITRDDISPALRKKVKALDDPTPILRALGTQIVGLTKRAFRDAGLRQTTWPNKKKFDPATGRLVDGEPSNLIKKGVLISSIRITDLTKTQVKVGSDRKYAAIHQLGGVIRPKNARALVFTIGGHTLTAAKVTMPPRPYFPFTKDGKLAAFAIEPVNEVLQLAVDKALGAT